MGDRTVNILGVPTSAGAYCVGVEQAPAALRDAGLVETLIAAGCDVNDHGDLTRQLWAPDPTNSYAQNLGEVVASTHELTAAASQVLSGTENVNRRNSGPTIAQLAPALAELVPHPDCWGITIGQLDPAHAASDPTAVPRLVDALAAAFAAPRPT